MAQLKQKLKTVLRPAPDTKVWPDVFLLIFFGTWFFAPVLYMVLHASTSSAGACSGPGFADFGCTGGWAAAVANTLGVAFMLILFGLFLVPLIRLINIWRQR